MPDLLTRLERKRLPIASTNSISITALLNLSPMAGYGADETGLRIADIADRAKTAIIFHVARRGVRWTPNLKTRILITTVWQHPNAGRDKQLRSDTMSSGDGISLATTPSYSK